MLAVTTLTRYCFQAVLSVGLVGAGTTCGVCSAAACSLALSCSLQALSANVAAHAMKMMAGILRMCCGLLSGGGRTLVHVAKRLLHDGVDEPGHVAAEARDLAHQR